MKRILWTTGLALLLVVTFTGVAWAQGEGQGEPDAGAVAVILAPLVAAATAIERLIEMVFNGYESAILNASSFLSTGRGYLGWAQEQVKRWRQATMWDKLKGDALREAEDALEDAQERLLAYLESPFYTSRKRLLSLLMGIVLGLVGAFVTRLQMFSLLGIELRWAWIDTLVTGLIIGTGSAPVHSLIGLLQNTKSAVDEARALWSGRAYSQGLEVELKKLGLDADLKRVKELQQQLQSALETVPKRPMRAVPSAVGEEPLAAAASAEHARAQTLVEEAKGLTAQSMGRAEMRRRVRGILR
jgi:hypothetical protein